MRSPVEPSKDLEAAIKPLVELIRQAIPDTQAIYAYGSYARGGIHPGSDLDLALLLPRQRELSPLEIARLQGDLEALAGFPVELSLLSPETQVVHCKEVVAHGRPVFMLDPRIVDEFEMYALSSYARLCEDRAPVVKAYTGVQNG
jgi:predicted nucleotidyltransferase